MISDVRFSVVDCVSVGSSWVTFFEIFLPTMAADVVFGRVTTMTESNFSICNHPTNVTWKGTISRGNFILFQQLFLEDMFVFGGACLCVNHCWKHVFLEARAVLSHWSFFAEITLFRPYPTASFLSERWWQWMQKQGSPPWWFLDGVASMCAGV